MKKIVVESQEYTLIRDEKNGFDEEAFKARLTEYFDTFDIIVGDWSYGQLRLKGFNEKGNKDLKSINDATKIEEYIKTYCAFDCKWFALKRETSSKEREKGESKIKTKQKS